MIHQMDGLSALEQARLNTADTPNSTRYPWEWVGILIICILGIAGAILADRNTTSNRQQGLEAQLQALEHRLHLHEQATSPEENE